MNRRRALPVAVSLATAAALLLSGCGGDESDSGKAKIAGADDGGGKKSPSPSASKSTGPKIDRPDLTLPSDVHLVFEKSDVKDADQLEAVGDAQRFVQAIRHGITEQDADDPGYKFYSVYQSDAQTYAKEQIQWRIDEGWTITGEMRFKNFETTPADDKSTTVVSFCSDSSKIYSKEVKSKKVHRTTGTAGSYDAYQFLMRPSRTTKGLWRAERVEVQTEVKDCS
ncbi:hypothetical protein [Streptomyces tsukubensis]|uniref:Lipoprotein n=1 Tax=Streptomyces tsukubensis TaxID=83656 RepID=A0A1V4A5Q0_9ACTN|nr:hypothetical protein [Streptomyces tsukubensis]OON76954.1 hypothetical protein B1H18_19520 [Streptomyces tsukubensis]QFR93818.1 hypothetical protein GBW32_12995 [Streptomyces tsukubensis]